MSSSDDEPLFDEGDVDYEDEEPESNDEGIGKSPVKSEYIYILTGTGYQLQSIYKYGYTEDPIRRLTEFFTHNLSFPLYLKVFRLQRKRNCVIKNNYLDEIFSKINKNPKKLKKIEHKIKKRLTKLRKFYDNDFYEYDNCGTEFIKNSEESLNLFMDIINTEFVLLGIEVEELTKEQVNTINKNAIKKYKEFNKYDSDSDLESESDIDSYVESDSKEENIYGDLKPYDYQLEILDKVENFYQNNDKGKLIWACGLGKALMSLFLCKKLKYDTILAGVPSRNLVNQFKKEACKLFEEDNILGIASHDTCTTNESRITNFINSRRRYKVIITTYHSCPKLKKICDSENFIFDFKIGDEAHHLVGCKENKLNKKIKIKNKDELNSKPEDIACFKKFHYIKSNKTLFMTATEKLIMDEDTYDNTILSMEDEKIFGNYIDEKSVFWAIENNKITDYWLYILRSTLKQVEYLIKKVGVDIKNKELFLSAYMTLKTFEKNKNLTHVLIYANKTVNADLIDDYIKLILDKKLIDTNKVNINDLYHKSLHSKMNVDENNEDINHNQCFDLEFEVKEFKKSKLGIISCVQIFGEGFDLPKLNGVVVGEKMDSEIRIVQSLLRPNRLEKENPNKKAFILCPFLDNSNYREIEKNDSYKKIKNIMFHLRNNDECVFQKTKLFDIDYDREKKARQKKDVEFIENEESLKNIKFCLRGSLKSELSDAEEEYKFVQRINKEMNIKSRKEYLESIDEHSYYFEDPESHFKRLGIWENWYDFLSVDTSKFIQTKDEWKKRCKELNIKSYQNYKEKISEYEELPEDPSDFYYNYNFRNIDYELDNVRERRR